MAQSQPDGGGEDRRPLVVDADTQANILAAIRSVNQNLPRRIINGVSEVMTPAPQQGRIFDYRGPLNMLFFGPDTFGNSFGLHGTNAPPACLPPQLNNTPSPAATGRRQTIHNGVASYTNDQARPQQATIATGSNRQSIDARHTSLPPLFHGQYYTGGFDAPIPGVPGRWEFMTMGQDHASAEFLARINLGGQGHFNPDINDPTAQEVYELRQYNRARFGNDGNTEGIDILWIADRDRGTDRRDASHTQPLDDHAATTSGAVARKPNETTQQEQQAMQRGNAPQDAPSAVLDTMREREGPVDSLAVPNEATAPSGTPSDL